MDKIYTGFDVQLHRDDHQSILNEYGEGSNHIPVQSVADVIVREPIDHSFHELFVNVNVGGIVSKV